jgi:hypothetical protein
MAWGEWMCPQLEPHHLLELERQHRAVAHYDLPQAQQTLLDLTQLLLRQDLILRGAVRRIAELECRLGLEAID